MSKKSLNIDFGKHLYNEVVCNVNKLPFSFVYNDKKIDSLSKYSISEKEDDNYLTRSYVGVIDNTLEITYVCKYNKEFSQIEYYAYIKNISNNISKEISNLISLDINVVGNDPLVRGNYGDLVKFYEAYENRLSHGDVRFKQDDGRCSHIVFPYFDLCFGNGGLLIALGWAGSWETLFTSEDNNTKVISKTCLNMNTCLLPNESIRTGLVVLLPYKNRNEDDASNLWREWYVKYNMPKGVSPFSTCMLANDTGVNNHDGSVSENNKTWKRSIDKLEKEGLLTNYRWIDAGWYERANHESSKDDWWGSVGCYEVDKEKYPNGSLKESVDYLHLLKMKTLLWFEPERVSFVDDLVKNYGYDKSWSYETPYSIYNNIGNGKCFNWTLNRIIKVLDENNIDMYREDNNLINHVSNYKGLDKLEEDNLHIARSGINENKCVLAHYKLLDSIISYQVSHNKSNFVDICAGGGGRNDIESLRRGIPIMRSDIDRGASSMRLSQTSTLARWLVYHGSSTKETDNSYKLYETKGASSYVARASYLPIFNLNEAFTYNTNLNYDQLRKNMDEWKSINHLLDKDFYRLTPYHHNTNKYGWTIFAYHDENKDDSVILAFRMENSDKDTYVIKLLFLNKDKKYEIINEDSKESSVIIGKDLIEKGLTLHIDKPKSSLLIRICR